MSLTHVFFPGFCEFHLLGTNFMRLLFFPSNFPMSQYDRLFTAGWTWSCHLRWSHLWVKKNTHQNFFWEDGGFYSLDWFIFRSLDHDPAFKRKDSILKVDIFVCQELPRLLFHLRYVILKPRVRVGISPPKWPKQTRGPWFFTSLA